MGKNHTHFGQEPQDTRGRQPEAGLDRPHGRPPEGEHEGGQTRNHDSHRSDLWQAVGTACARHRAPSRYTKYACGRTSQITDHDSRSDLGSAAACQPSLSRSWGRSRSRESRRVDEFDAVGRPCGERPARWRSLWTSWRPQSGAGLMTGQRSIPRYSEIFPSLGARLDSERCPASVPLRAVRIGCLLGSLLAATRVEP